MLSGLEYDHVGPRKNITYPKLSSSEERLLAPYITLLEENSDRSEARAARNYLRFLIPKIPSRYRTQLLRIASDVGKAMEPSNIQAKMDKLSSSAGQKTVNRETAIKLPGGERVSIADVTMMLSGLTVIAEAYAEVDDEGEGKVWRGRGRQMFEDMKGEGWLDTRH